MGGRASGRAGELMAPSPAAWQPMLAQRHAVAMRPSEERALLLLVGLRAHPEKPPFVRSCLALRVRPAVAGLGTWPSGRDAKQHATHLHAVPQLQFGGASVGRCASACESGIRAFNAGGVPVGERGHGVPVGESGGVGWTEPDGDAHAGEVERDAGCDEGVGLLPRKGAVDSGDLGRCPGGCENLSVWWGSNASTA